MSDCHYVARIGSWTLVIGFAKELTPPDYLVQGLSFLLEPMVLYSHKTMQPEIQFHYLNHPITISGLEVKKQDRTVHWNQQSRIITGPRLQVKVLKPFRLAEISCPAAWEDLADLLEAWVGFHYEMNRGVRLHALATKDFTLIAPSGFGKTHYALINLESVIGDEVVYVHQDLIENWYSALRIKEAGTWNSRHGPRRVIGIKTHPQILPFIKLGNCSWWSILFGLGLPQHLEFSLFISSLPGWIKIAGRRLLFITKHRLFFAPIISREDLYKSPKE